MSPARIPLSAVALTAILLGMVGCGFGSATDSTIGITPPGGGGDAEGPSEGEMAFAFAVLERTNEERQARDLPPLTWHEPAAQVAYEHSWDMDARAYFDHVDPDGQGPDDRLRAAGIGFTLVAENLAWGQGSPDEVVDVWMSSPGHRANILDPKLTHVGVGVHTRTGGGPWWTQVFLMP